MIFQGLKSLNKCFEVIEHFGVLQTLDLTNFIKEQNLFNKQLVIKTASAVFLDILLISYEVCCLSIILASHLKHRKLSLRQFIAS